MAQTATRADAPGITRRSLIGAASAASFVPFAASSASPGTPLGRDAFAFEGTFLNAAYTHPVSRNVAAAIQAFTQERQRHVDRAWTGDNYRDGAVAQFALLTNTNPGDLAIVPSTMTGENLLADALGLGPTAGVVTDALHYFGSLALYQQKAAAGMPLTVVRPRDHAIDLADVEAAIDGRTRLIAVSLVSGLNGFAHDLKALCDMAHRHGVLVYADLIQAAGAVPIDLPATGVDFACCGSYKWLMGDFGLGFLYVRADLHDRLRRTRYGYYQLGQFDPHVYPFDAPATKADYPIADVTPRPDMEGLFAGGTHAHVVSAMLDWSLEHILALGVDRIAAYRQPLLQRLHAGLASRGYRVVTPPESRTPLVTCVLEGARERLAAPLKAAKVQITLSRNRFRVSPSVFNTMDDIERLLAALPRA